MLEKREVLTILFVFHLIVSFQFKMWNILSISLTLLYLSAFFFLFLFLFFGNYHCSGRTSYKHVFPLRLTQLYLQEVLNIVDDDLEHIHFQGKYNSPAVSSAFLAKFNGS